MTQTYSRGMFILLFIIYLLEKAEAPLLNPVHFSNIGLPVTKNHAVSPKPGQPNPHLMLF